jgi:glycosyltransferase involved in cell wall biosynthesis
MKILHVIDSMDLDRGGPPQVCAHLIANQSVEHEVSLASYSDPLTCQKLVSIDHLACHEVKFTGISEAFFGVASKRILSDVIKEVDLVHIHNVWEPILMSAASIARQNQVPYVVTPHGMLDPWSMSQKSAKKKLALLAGRRKMLENAKFIHVLNQEEDHGIRKIGISNRCEIIANGVDLKKIDPFLNKLKFEAAFPEFAGKPFVLFLSRLHYKKGLDILGDVAKDFCTRFPDWLILVAGPDGGAKSDFETQISNQGLEERVHLLGPIYGDLKYSLLNACEFYCLPSRQEGFSVAILEAMAASKPVAITTHCHFGDVEVHRCGFVDSLDLKAIAESFGKLASSTEVRGEFGQNARKLIQDHYTWTKISHSLLEAYQS